MSSLARSLLALAALFAVAAARSPPKCLETCVEGDIGRKGTYNEKLPTIIADCRNSPVPIDIPDICPSGVHSGEHVKACNPNGGPAPTIEFMNIYRFLVFCNDPAELTVKIDITEYCL